MCCCRTGIISAVAAQLGSYLLVDAAAVHCGAVKGAASTHGELLQVYQDLCKEHKTFRDRSENVDVSVEVTLQPWEAFKPDGVVLFSDILTPLTGMNIPFDIVAGKGPIIEKPIRTLDDVAAITKLDAEGATPYVGEALRRVKKAVGNDAAVLGFAGAPFTLASYIVEGASSKNYSTLKEMAFSNSEVLMALLDKLTENVTDYCRYQADNKAEVCPCTKRGITGTPPRLGERHEESGTVGCRSSKYSTRGHRTCRQRTMRCLRRRSRARSSPTSRRRTLMCPSSCTSQARVACSSAWHRASQTAYPSMAPSTSRTRSTAAAPALPTKATWTRAACSAARSSSRSELRRRWPRLATLVSGMS